MERNPIAVLRYEGERLKVILYEPSGRGGVCHYTYELAEHLVRAGAEVTLMTTEDYELEHLDRHFRLDYLFTRSWLTRLRRRPVPQRPSLAPVGRVVTGQPGTRGQRGLLRRLRMSLLHLRAVAGFLRRRPDVVHFQWLVNRVQDYKFIKLLRLVGIPAVYTAHDVEPHMTASPKDRVELQRLYDSAARIIVHAESNKRELVSVFAVDPSKIAVIPHGSYDFLRLRVPLSKETARERVGVPREKRVVLFFGLIKRYKGLEYLVEAFEEVRGRVRDAFLLIVGDVFAGDPEGHRYYSQMIDGLRGRDDVLCVASYVPVEAVGLYLTAADVVVLPYTRTYQSGVLLAAYAAGRPVVVTDTGGLSEVVEEGRSGLVVPPENAKALANAIGDILADSERLNAMGERARHLATALYGWDAIASRTIALYESVVRESRLGRQSRMSCFQ
jgi:glycosyltransferase involved in cell wall biosynthesis